MSRSAARPALPGSTPALPSASPDALRRPITTIRARSTARQVFGGQGNAAGIVLSLIALALLGGPLYWVLAAGGPPIVGIIVGVIVLAIAPTIASERSLRVEWDGHEVVQRSIGQRRVIGTAGEGEVRSLAMSNPILPDQHLQMWIDRNGRRTTMNADRWDAADMRALAEQARIPVVEVGRLTPEEFFSAYAGERPRIAALLAQQASFRKQQQAKGPWWKFQRPTRLQLALVTVVVVAPFLDHLAKGS